MDATLTTMTKAEKIAQFDPSGAASHNGIFGLPFTLDEAKVAIVPVPWEVTVSYASGTADGPEAVAKASYQVDLFDPFIPDAWKMGIALVPPATGIAEKSQLFRPLAAAHIEEINEPFSADRQKRLDQINAACAEMVATVAAQTGALMDQGKLVALLGGDHSTPLGYLQALAARHEAFGVLQIDAHADLRNAFEGFHYSHASISYNFMQLHQIKKLVQVGIRDYCEEEFQYIQQNKERVQVFFDRDLKHAAYNGVTWAQQVQEIVAALPQKVYLSFDIDGLDPKLCPNTGTPVAGGFEVEQILYLVEQLLASGRTLIGLDLNEVAPGADEWDANVGARLLYRLCNLLGR